MNDATGIKELLAAADLVAETNHEIAAPSAGSGRPSDMDRLMSTGARLLKSKTDEHLALTSAYERDRVALVDSYRVRIERLRIEAEEQLRTLEIGHAEKLGAVERLIAKLKALRNAQ